MTMTSKPYKDNAPPPINWLADWAHLSDESELMALFSSAFGHDMPPRLWRWKYAGQDPIGALVRRDGRLVAFYGGTPRVISLFGVPTTAIQIGDIMVHPDERGILTRKGAFFLAATTFLERYVGDGKVFPLAFGFPSNRHNRLGERLGLYAKVGEIMRVTWSALKTLPSPLLRVCTLDIGMGAAVDRLWAEMAAALSHQIVGVRDFNYLRRRYLEHPTISYRVFFASRRLASTPFGIIVVRELDDELELVDIIAPPQRLAALVKIVRRLAWNLDKPQAYAWISSQHAELMAAGSGVISPTEISVPTCAWTQGTAPAELYDCWWLMSGDTDFR
jgi:hypothetical protein